jgi:hypothetical protein
MAAFIMVRRMAASPPGRDSVATAMRRVKNESFEEELS